MGYTAEKKIVWTNDAASVPDGSIDVIYVDGNHQDLGPERDLQLAVQKPKPQTGLIALHHFSSCQVEADRSGSVKTTVMRFLDSNTEWEIKHLALHWGDAYDVVLGRKR